MEPTFPVLQDLIVPQGFIDLPDGTAKEHALTTLGRMACGEAQVPAARVEEVLTAIRAKEKIMSSGIGGIALAHVRHEAVAKDTIRVGRARHGLEFESLDRKPVYLVFLILLHAGDPHRLLTIISEILAALRPEARRTHVVSSPDATTFVERILATK